MEDMSSSLATLAAQSALESKLPVSPTSPSPPSSKGSLGDLGTNNKLPGFTKLVATLPPLSDIPADQPAVLAPASVSYKRHITGDVKAVQAHYVTRSECTFSEISSEAGEDPSNSNSNQEASISLSSSGGATTKKSTAPKADLPAKKRSKKHKQNASPTRTVSPFPKTRRQQVAGVRCPHCPSQFFAKHQLYEHARQEHLHFYPCTECTATFMRPHYLHAHRMIVHDEEGFLCHVCRIWLKTDDDWEQHMMNHHGDEKCYNCGKCEEHFREIDELKSHVRQKHANEEGSVRKRTYVKKATNSNL